MSTGGGTINPGDIKEYSYAIIFTPDVPHPCPALGSLAFAADIIENFDCIVNSVEPNFAEEIDLQISPNPVQKDFTVSLKGENKNLKDIEIINLSGNILQKRKDVNAPSFSFNTENLPAGIYFVKVRTQEGKVGVQKLVVQ